MHPQLAKVAVTIGALSLPVVNGLTLNTEDPASIKAATAAIVYDLLKTYYTGNVTGADQVGLLPRPYYWWEAGAMWGGLVDYSHYTGDASYIKTVSEAIVSQSSPTIDFMMPNQRNNCGNDDQVFWALSAMSAAEYNFPVPDGTPATRYIDLAINTFNSQYPRWNTTTCGGGLKWQIFPENRGYDYKSSIANGGFFQLSARLARYSGNQTYADWAEKAWNWMEGVGFLNTEIYRVLDGAGDNPPGNCTAIDQHEWSYNSAALIYGAANMANFTDSDIWRNRTQGLVRRAISTFFSPFANSTDIMFEAACEKTHNCNTDQFSFKAYLARWMAKATVLVSEVAPDVQRVLKASAAAAAQSCSGEAGGRTCGTTWYTPGWDGVKGVGQQMTALETIQSLLISQVAGPQKGSGVPNPGSA